MSDDQQSRRTPNPAWGRDDDPGRVVTAKFPSKCVDCGGTINVGDEVLLRQFKPHHVGSCPTSTLPQGSMDRPQQGIRIGATSQRSVSSERYSDDTKVTLTPQREPAIPNGAYTLLKGGSEPFTLKVHTVHQSGAAFDGKTVISYYSSDSSNWVSYAFLGDDDLIHVWKRFYDQPDLKAAAEALLDPSIRAKASARYRNAAKGE